MSASPRIAAAVAGLPLAPGMRVLEVGCGPGAALRLVAERVGPTGHVLGLDRSATALAQAARGCAALVAAGRVSLRRGEAADFALRPGEAPFDLAFGLRVGVLDGRHPGGRALAALAAALAPGGRLFADPDGVLREIALPGR